MNKDELERLRNQNPGFRQLSPEIPVKETVTKSGLILPNGDHMLITNQNLSGAVRMMWARQLKAKLFGIQGSLVFYPDFDSVTVSELREK